MNRFEIIFEDDHFVAISKPSGLLSIPDREGKEISLKNILQQKRGEIFTVHRLDRLTSGVIVFAKDAESHRKLCQLFEERQTEKIYFGLVHGSVSPISGTIEAPIMAHPSGNGKMIIHAKGKPSLTEYQVVERFKLFSWVKFRIHTGRTHQVRVHAVAEEARDLHDQQEIQGDDAPREGARPPRRCHRYEHIDDAELDVRVREERDDVHGGRPDRQRREIAVHREQPRASRAPPQHARRQQQPPEDRRADQGPRHETRSPRKMPPCLGRDHCRAPPRGSAATATEPGPRRDRIWRCRQRRLRRFHLHRRRHRWPRRPWFSRSVEFLCFRWNRILPRWIAG